MRRPAARRPAGLFWTLGGLALVVLAGRLAPVPPLVVTGAESGEPLRLLFPPAYELFAPFMASADRLTFLSASQWRMLALWLAGGWALFRGAVVLRASWSWRREAAWAAGAALGLAAFAAFAVWLGRPCATLASSDPDLLIVDFHSHTDRSWDGRRGFDAAANADWHRRAGFHAAFVTDHNTLAPGILSEGEGPFRTLAGQELSLHGLHLVALGCREPIDRSAFAGPDGIAPAIERVRACGGAALASLPEYWKHHWSESGPPDWSVDGFELLNGAPKALDLPGSARSAVEELCRRRNLACVAVTDNHGWGAAAPGWSVVRLRGWRSDRAEDLERRIVRELRERGAAAVSIAARPRIAPDGRLFFDPLRQALLWARSMTGLQSAVTLAWLGLAAWVAVKRPQLF